MKTAEQVIHGERTTVKDCDCHLCAKVRPALLDAVKHGMTLAADKVRISVENAYKGTTHMNEYGHGVKKGMLEASSLILTARDNLTSL